MITRYRPLSLALLEFGRRVGVSEGFLEGRIKRATRMAKLVAKWDGRLMVELALDKRKRPDGTFMSSRQQMWRRAFHGIRIVDLDLGD